MPYARRRQQKKINVCPCALTGSSPSPSPRTAIIYKLYNVKCNMQFHATETNAHFPFHLLDDGSQFPPRFNANVHGISHVANKRKRNMNGSTWWLIFMTIEILECIRTGRVRAYVCLSKYRFNIALNQLNERVFGSVFIANASDGWKGIMRMLWNEREIFHRIEKSTSIHMHTNERARRWTNQFFFIVH